MTPREAYIEVTENTIASLRAQLTKAEALVLLQQTALQQAYTENQNLHCCTTISPKNGWEALERQTKILRNSLAPLRGVKILAKLEAAEEMAKVIKHVDDWFEGLRADHDEKLGKSFKEACENWDQLSQEPLDMKPLRAALAGWLKANEGER